MTGTIRVRSGEAQAKLKQGDRTYYYTLENGESRIASVTGVGIDGKLLERLRAAKPDNCNLCLRADMWRKVTDMIMLEFLE